MPGNGNGGGGGNITSFSTGWVSGEGGTQQAPTGGGGDPALTSGEGGGGKAIDLSGWIKPKPEAPGPPPPRVPVIREARNVQRANIDRSSLYDPTAATQALGADYLQTRNASNPQPLGSTGAGAVGYEFTPSDERLY